MDGFKQWWKDCDKIFTIHDLSLKLHFGEILEELARNTWRESAKQKGAEIDGLNAIIGQQGAIIENLEMSVKSFTDSNVDLVAREREQYGDLPSEVLITLRHARTFIASRQQMHKAGVELHDDLINRIEKDSK